MPSSPHANDCALAVTRLINLGIEPYKIAGSLIDPTDCGPPRAVFRRCARRSA